MWKSTSELGYYPPRRRAAAVADDDVASMAWGARNLISTQVTNVHRIGETIGDAWPLVAVDRVHRGGKWARDRQAFNKNKKHLTDHDAPRSATMAR